MPLKLIICIDEVTDLFAQIERFKTLVQLALQDDLMYEILRAISGIIRLRTQDSLSSYQRRHGRYHVSPETDDRSRTVCVRYFLFADRPCWYRNLPFAL